MFTEEQKKRIAEALGAKHLNPCPSCGRIGTWNVGDGIVAFPFQVKSLLGLTSTVQSYPCVPILCSFCGNTMFHNAFTLGVAELLGLTPTPVLPEKVGG